MDEREDEKDTTQTQEQGKPESNTKTLWTAGINSKAPPHGARSQWQLNEIINARRKIIKPQAPVRDKMRPVLEKTSQNWSTRP